MSWTFRQWMPNASPDDIAKLPSNVRDRFKPLRALTNDGSAVVLDGEGNPVAHVLCQSDYKRGEGHKAECAKRDEHASLIAAGPKLLEALKEWADYCDNDPQYAAIREGVHGKRMAKTRAAITLATGATNV